MDLCNTTPKKRKNVLRNRISAPWKSDNDVFAIKFHKGTHEFIYGLMEGVGKGIDMNLALITDDVNHGLLFLGELGEEVQLLRFALGAFPSHGS